MRHEGSFAPRQNNCNVGYGFINFVTSEDLKRFYYSFHCKRWGKFKSEKVYDMVNRYVNSHMQDCRDSIASLSISKTRKYSLTRKRSIIRSSASSNQLSTLFASRSLKSTSMKLNDHFFNFLQYQQEHPQSHNSTTNA